MHFQKWSSLGYITSTREESTDSITTGTIINERDVNFLGNKILMREAALSADEAVQEFFDTFKGPSSGFSQDALAKDKSEWLNYYNSMMGTFFKSKFRRMGVVSYFAQETVDAPKYARKIVGKIEESLFTKWENGVYGSMQLEEYIKLLIKDCDKRIQEFSKSVKSYELKLEEKRRELTTQQDSVTKTGLLGNMLGKREDRFQAFCDATRDYYVERTRSEAIKYAIVLLENVKTALQDLEKSIIRFSVMLSTMTEMAEEQKSKRCGDEKTNDAKTLKKYDKKAVEDIRDKAERSEDIQQQMARNVRASLVGVMRDTAGKGFRQFLKAFNANGDNLDNASAEALNVVLESCLESAQKEVETRSLEEELLKVTNVNILEKLRQEYDDPSGEKLRAFAQEMMESAQTFVKFNNSEVSRQSNGNRNKTMDAVIVYLPEEKDDSGFRDRLATAFKDAKGNPEKVEIMTSHRNDQIAIMSLHSMFPLRYVENLKTLKESYDKLYNSPDNTIHRLVLHTESFDEPLPSLFEADQIEASAELPKPVMLGFAMGIIRESTDSATGRKGFYLFTTDKYGDENRSQESMGKDFLSVVKSLSANRKAASQLKDEVKSRLSKCIHVDARKELMDKVNGVLRSEVLAACGGDEFSEEYTRYKKIRNEIGENELSID